MTAPRLCTCRLAAGPAKEALLDKAEAAERCAAYARAKAARLARLALDTRHDQGKVGGCSAAQKRCRSAHPEYIQLSVSSVSVVFALSNSLPHGNCMRCTAGDVLQV